MKQIIIILLGLIFFVQGCSDNKSLSNRKTVNHSSTNDVHNHDDEKEDDHDDEQEDDHDDEMEITISPKAQELIQLKLENVTQKKIYKSINLTGEVVPNKDTIQHIYAKYPGLVTRISVNLGSKVSRGSVLATIQNKETLSYYNVNAMLYGTVIEKNISLGQVVGEDVEMFTIANLNDVWVEFDVYSDDIQTVKRGQKIIIESEISEQTVEGRISYVSPVISSITRSKTVRVVLNNRSGLWSPGSFVSGTIQSPLPGIYKVVPNEAIQILDGETVIFIPESNDTFRAEQVKIGMKDKTHTQILSDIPLDQKVVTRGAFELKAKIVSSSLGGHAGHGH